MFSSSYKTTILNMRAHDVIVSYQFENGADLEQKCDERRPTKNLDLASLYSLVTAQMTTRQPNSVRLGLRSPYVECKKVNKTNICMLAPNLPWII